jgi:hypothetical protein
VNTFAINAVALNESNEIWSWYGDADVVLQADGDVILGLTGSSAMSVVVLADLTPQLKLFTSGAADVVLQADAEALYGRAGAADLLVSLTAAGEGVRWTFGASDLSAVFQADGDGQVVSQVSSSFNIQFDAELDGRAATVQQGVADWSMAFGMQLDWHVARPAFLEGDAPVLFGMEALANLYISSPTGSAATSWLLNKLESRLGDKLYGEGAADLQWIATGDAQQWHYQYAEGAVDLQVLCVAERHGLPVLPTEFIAAPLVRSLWVGAEPRALIVPAERRA